MGKLIDSSVFIAADRGKLDLDAVLNVHTGEPIALASITASELLHGVHRASGASIRTRREAFVERVLGSLHVISFDLAMARIHASIWAELASQGLMIGTHDLLIGATALSIGYDVATHNEREFKRIPGLSVVKW